ncbi:MAG: hypothetical protein AAFZ07_01220 [Actinomycetota bacterium]
MGLPVGGNRAWAMLFTDLEASTELLAALDQAYEPQLEVHHALLRDAVGRASGEEVSNPGDGFFFVFPSIARAIDAAVRAQRSLRRHPWPSGHPFRVRMGVHVGRAKWAEAIGFSGVEVHRAARVADSANGGQCLLTGDAVEQLTGGAPLGTRLVDVGRYQLRSFGEQVEHLYELVIDERRCQRRVRARSIESTAVPSFPGRLIGRSAELEAVGAAIASGARLISLVGVGGVGKTRIAAEVAIRTGGVFVDARDHHAGRSLAAVLAAALALEPATDVIDALAAELRHRPRVLVVDGVDRFVEDTDVLGRLLGLVDDLVVVTTSQPLLRTGHGRVVRVDPFDVTVAQQLDEAIELFGDAARRSGLPGVAEADRATIGDICERVGGHPLAIELAAGGLAAVGGAAALLDSLARPTVALVGGRSDAPLRHRSLAASLEDSFGLLSPGASALLEQLALLPAGAGGRLAELMGEQLDADMDVLQRELGEFGLLSVRRDARSDRIIELSPLAGDAARRSLTASGQDRVAMRAVASLLARLSAEQSAQLLSGSQHDAMVAIDECWENFATLFGRVPDDPRLLEDALATGANLVTYWWMTNPLEGMAQLEALAQDADPSSSRFCAPALVRAALLASWAGCADRVESLASRGVAAARHRDRPTATLSHGLQLLALSWAASGRLRNRRRCLAAVRESLSIDAELPVEVRAIHTTNVADVLMIYDRLGDARQLFEESRRLLEGLGEGWLVATPRSRLAEVALRQGEFVSAHREALASAEIYRASRSRSGPVRALSTLGRVLRAQDDQTSAAAVQAEAWELLRRSSAQGEAPWALIGLAATRVDRGDADGAAELFGAALVLGLRFGQPVAGAIRRELHDAYRAAGWRAVRRQRTHHVASPTEAMLALGDRYAA